PSRGTAAAPTRTPPATVFGVTWLPAGCGWPYRLVRSLGSLNTVEVPFERPPCAGRSTGKSRGHLQGRAGGRTRVPGDGQAASGSPSTSVTAGRGRVSMLRRNTSGRL